MDCFNFGKNELSCDIISNSSCLLAVVVVSLILIELLEGKMFNLSSLENNSYKYLLNVY